MKTIELTVTLYFKEDEGLDNHQIMDVCENTANAIVHSDNDNISSKTKQISVIHKTDDGGVIMFGKDIR